MFLCVGSVYLSLVILEEIWNVLMQFSERKNQSRMTRSTSSRDSKLKKSCSHESAILAKGQSRSRRLGLPCGSNLFSKALAFNRMSWLSSQLDSSLWSLSTTRILLVRLLLFGDQKINHHNTEQTFTTILLTQLEPSSLSLTIEKTIFAATIK